MTSQTHSLNVSAQPCFYPLSFNSDYKPILKGYAGTISVKEINYQIFQLHMYLGESAFSKEL